ncbi:MAG: hypothetical protein WKF40_10015 [Thermoleophilaceae bacterium]
MTPDKLPDDGAKRGRLYERLGRVLDIPAARIRRSVDRQLKALPYSPATVKQDVPSQLVYYLFEHQEDFPGVTVEQVFLREYPHRQVGAHLFGTVGEITKEQKADDRYRGVGLGRPRGPVGHRVPVRPLPAGPQRRQPGAGRRPGQPARAAAQRPPPAGSPAAVVRRPRRAEGRPAGAGRQGRRLRGHERERRGGAGPGLLALV